MNPQDPMDRIRFLLGTLIVEREALLIQVQQLQRQTQELAQAANGAAKPVGPAAGLAPANPQRQTF